jgi:hypothetical protein
MPKLPNDIRKIIRSYDPHLSAIRNSVKLRTIEDDGWLESFLHYFLETTNPHAYAIASSTRDSALRRESRVYLNRLLELIWVDGRRFSSSPTGVISMNRAAPS